MYRQVKSSSPLEFGAGTRLGNRLEFLDASLLPPEPLQRVLKSNSSNTFVCPGNSFSHYRLLPAERLLSRDLPQYRLLVSGCPRRLQVQLVVMAACVALLIPVAVCDSFPPAAWRRGLDHAIHRGAVLPCSRDCGGALPKCFPAVCV